MSPEEIVKQAEAAYAAHDIDRVADLFDPEVVVYFNGKKEFEGRDAVVEFEREQFESRITKKMKKTLRAASGNIIAVEWEALFVDKASGEIWEFYGGEFWTMHDNRLLEWHNYGKSYSDKVEDNG
jgi:nuclear transport factor 2 (NTF2) superfamily protein